LNSAGPNGPDVETARVGSDSVNQHSAAFAESEIPQLGLVPSSQRVSRRAAGTFALLLAGVTLPGLYMSFFGTFASRAPNSDGTGTPAIINDSNPAQFGSEADESWVRVKSDRLPVPAQRNSLAAAFTEVSSLMRGGGITITTNMTDAPGTMAMPILGYAAFGEPEIASPFDRLLVAPPVDPLDGRAPTVLFNPEPHQTIAPPVAEEDDDVAALLPIPHPKPRLGVLADGRRIPLPRPKPDGSEEDVETPVAATQPQSPASDLAGSSSRPTATADASAAPPPYKPGAILQRPLFAALPAGRTRPEAEKQDNQQVAMYAPPGDTMPRNPVILDTPFGVPYVLQSESVETACLRPELMDILTQIETRYGKKVVITSGYRARGRPSSLHRRCAAADIIVPGVDGRSLAAFARTIPHVGGVGQYCHPNMIHLDVGSPRDWKYGCGSYFAMRAGAPGERGASSEE
jgi:hypothetical protein